MKIEVLWLRSRKLVDVAVENEESRINLGTLFEPERKELAQTLRQALADLREPVLPDNTGIPEGLRMRAGFIQDQFPQSARYLQQLADSLEGKGL